MLEPEASPQSVLKALVERGVDIEAYEVAALPLEDIFIKVVRDRLGLDQGQSAAADATPAPVGGAR